MMQLFEQNHKVWNGLFCLKCYDVLRNVHTDQLIHKLARTYLHDSSQMSLGCILCTAFTCNSSQRMMWSWCEVFDQSAFVSAEFFDVSLMLGSCAYYVFLIVCGLQWSLIILECKSIIQTTFQSWYILC